VRLGLERPAQTDSRIWHSSRHAAAPRATGEVDQLSSINPTDVRRLPDTGKYDVQKFLRLGVGLFMEFTVTRRSFGDLNVRKALSYAITIAGVLAGTAAATARGGPFDGVVMAFVLLGVSTLMFFSACC
jgi:hypothetical protein